MLNGSRIWLLSLSLWFCTPNMAQTTLQTEAFLVDLHTSRPVTVDELHQVLRTADVAVWGEVHDNPRHHALRAEWLRMLAKPGLSVVAEHLTAPQLFDAQQELLTGLQRAGFDAPGWQWPMHQALFASVADLGLPLWGGNLSKEDSKHVFKTKGDAAANELKNLLHRAELNPSEQQELMHEIDEGHCGALPGNLFEGMMAVQRARDASMAHMAMQHLPAVVLAGNGHAWRDLGVPQIIRRNRPDLKVVSVLFLEHAPFVDDAQRQAWLNNLAGKADYIWSGPPISRDDPCLAFKPQK